MADGGFGAVFAQTGLSLEEAEEELGISVRHIRRYVAGDVEPPKLVRERVRRIVDERLAARPPGRFRFIDLFAGIGGLRLGFEAIGGRCVFTSEWDRWSNETYRINFPDDPKDHQLVGDIRPYGADPSRIPHHDVFHAACSGA